MIGAVRKLIDSQAAHDSPDRAPVDSDESTPLKDVAQAMSEVFSRADADPSGPKESATAPDPEPAQAPPAAEPCAACGKVPFGMGRYPHACSAGLEHEVFDPADETHRELVAAALRGARDAGVGDRDAVTAGIATAFADRNVQFDTSAIVNDPDWSAAVADMVTKRRPAPDQSPSVSPRARPFTPEPVQAAGPEPGRPPQIDGAPSAVQATAARPGGQAAAVGRRAGRGVSRRNPISWFVNQAARFLDYLTRG